RKLDTIYDMDDATKVVTGPGDRIVKIGKMLPEFDAVDTGVFRCAPALFDALQRVLDEKGDTSLSDGVQALVAQDKARVVDVGAAWWQDVDTPGSKKHAEKLLFKSLTKAIDGPVSKHINRKISKSITRLLVNTNVVPNHMTFVGLLVGLAASIVTLMVTPSSLWLIPLGGVLFQLSSAIDGCDGEIARLKFKHSDWGEWFDTIVDDVVNTTYILSMGIAVTRLTGESLWWQLGATTFVVGWIVAGSLYKKLLENGKGTHLAIEWDFQNARDPNWFQRFCDRFMFVAKRDFYAFALMVVSFFGAPAFKVMLALSVVVVGIVGFQWALTAAREAAGRRRELTRVEG
ncbi:MAG: CDP-alcohol phosphatidyltransferase family protein, partial [Myxococcales bacterium]|nr:CDP-alcohol phosphatidyltransferase family protein [Myxococcales bacterium]